MRIRFTLRTLLVLTALAAALCYWWVARPSIVAKQFQNALHRGDYTAARRLWIDKTEFLRDFEFSLISSVPTLSR